MLKHRFLNIDFEYQRPLWSWSKIRATLLVFWYITWRFVILVLPLSIIFMTGMIVLYLKHFPVDLFEGKLSSTHTRDILLSLETYIPYLEHQQPWATYAFALFPMLLGNMYLNYRALYKKRYKTFDLICSENIPFWSTYFWKRSLMFFGLATLLLPPFVTLPLYIEILSWIGLSGLSHIALHTRFWGVFVKEKL